MRVGANGVLGEGIAAALFDLWEVIKFLVGEQSFNVIPRRLVVGRLGNPRQGSVDLLLQGGEMRGMCEDVVALIPGGVIAVVLRQQEVEVGKLVIPKVVGLDHPLTIGPSMVVLRVRLDQTGGKLELTRKVTSEGHQPLTVVPDLVVLRVLGRHIVSELKVFLD